MEKSGLLRSPLSFLGVSLSPSRSKVLAQGLIGPAGWKYLNKVSGVHIVHFNHPPPSPVYRVCKDDKMKWRKYSKSVRIDNTLMVMDNEKNTYLLFWQMRYVTIPFGAGTQSGGWNSGGWGNTSFTPLNTPLCTLIHPFSPFFIFPTPYFFPQQSFTSFPTTKEFFFPENSVCGEAGIIERRRKNSFWTGSTFENV